MDWDLLRGRLPLFRLDANFSNPLAGMELLHLQNLHDSLSGMTSSDHTTSGADRIAPWSAVRRTLSAQVARRLRDAIVAGTYRAGERMPSERELCVLCGVSRTVLREAQRELIRAGFVEVRHGVGTYVRSRQDLQQTALSDWLAHHDDSIVKLIEMRALLEPGIAELAARRADRKGITALRESVKTMRQGGNIDEVITADERFHLILAGLSGNSMVVQLIDYTLHAMGGERKITLSTPDGILAAADGHARVVDAIARHDPEAASAAMREHLEDARRYATRDMNSQATLTG